MREGEEREAKKKSCLSHKYKGTPAVSQKINQYTYDVLPYQDETGIYPGPLKHINIQQDE
jgi:hypothetical protein